MNTYWFKPKTYGWGYVPISWEGYSLTGLLIGGILILSYFFGVNTETDPSKQTLLFFIATIVSLLILFLFIANRKTKESFRFRWGVKNDNAQDQGNNPIEPK